MRTIAFHASHSGYSSNSMRSINFSQKTEDTSDIKLLSARHNAHQVEKI